MKVASLFLMIILAASAAADTDLEQLEWLAGHWIAEDGAYEEVWLEPAGGTMVGSFRWIFPNQRQVLEFLIIAADSGGVSLRFKHFERNFEPWEKEAPNSYRLEKASGQTASFVRTGSNQDVPYRLTYVRDGDRLTFVGEGDPGSEGDPLRLEFQRR